MATTDINVLNVSMNLRGMGIPTTQKGCRYNQAPAIVTIESIKREADRLYEELTPQGFAVNHIDVAEAIAEFTGYAKHADGQWEYTCSQCCHFVSKCNCHMYNQFLDA